MKTYRINKTAERLAQGTGFAPELIYNISHFRLQGRNGRCGRLKTLSMKSYAPQEKLRCGTKPSFVWHLI